MTGIGGIEIATRHKLDRLRIGDAIQVLGFALHVGRADYGRDLGGLLGLDFLRLTGAIIDLRRWTIDFDPAVQSGG
jgi:hypothetical protein